MKRSVLVRINHKKEERREEKQKRVVFVAVLVLSALGWSAERARA